ncbi:hypothetical protein PISMIDRAFT_681702 [Pisolithus microcarpus 441]|uniref:Uncharacterized protein n=1 Tax=Pisolithus microcarpus 441 TaxID=765257 RepID=A0A0C9YWH4_9AGAM|nr:hypothetical protein PISMIDRAFT_681702 [Pisolithus microcarpus 441]
MSTSASSSWDLHLCHHLSSEPKNSHSLRHILPGSSTGIGTGPPSHRSQHCESCILVAVPGLLANINSVLHSVLCHAASLWIRRVCYCTTSNVSRTIITECPFTCGITT